MKESREDYSKRLAEWSQNADAFLQKWNGELKLFIEIEFESERDPNLSRELEEFKKKMRGKAFDAESCAYAYLIHEENGNPEQAFEGFMNYLSAVTQERIKIQSNIFGYYKKLIDGIRREYAALKGQPHAARMDERLKTLYDAIIGNVNTVLTKICTGKFARSNKSRFRRFRSDVYPNIHDEYCDYLKVLSTAVQSAGSKSVEYVLRGVK